MKKDFNVGDWVMASPEWKEGKDIDSPVYHIPGKITRKFKMGLEYLVSVSYPNHQVVTWNMDFLIIAKEHYLDEFEKSL